MRRHTNKRGASAAAKDGDGEETVAEDTGGGTVANDKGKRAATRGAAGKKASSDKPEEATKANSEQDAPTRTGSGKPPAAAKKVKEREVDDRAGVEEVPRTAAKPPPGPRKKALPTPGSNHEPLARRAIERIEGDVKRRRLAKPAPPRNNVKVHRPLREAEALADGAAKSAKVGEDTGRGAKKRDRGFRSVLARAKRDAADGDDSDGWEDGHGVEVDDGEIGGLQIGEDLPGDDDVDEERGVRARGKSVGRSGVKRGSGAAEREAELADYVKRLNEAETIVSDMRRTHRYLQSSLDDKNEKVAQLQKKVEALELDNVALRAEADAALETTSPKISNTGTVPRGGAAGTANKVGSRAKKIGLQKREEAKLPAVQRRILEDVKDSIIDFAKAVVRQCDPEQYLLKDKQVYKWLPRPEKLRHDVAGEEFESSAGYGSLGPLTGGVDFDAVEPPMMCWNKGAMTGGLFGAYPGRKRDWLIILAKIVAKRHATWDDLAEDKDGDVTRMTAGEMVKHCKAFCNSGAAPWWNSALNERIDNQASYRKTIAVRELMMGFGFKWSAAERRCVASPEEAALILRRVLGIGWELDDDDDDEPPPLMLLKMVKKKGSVPPKQLRRWRSQPITELCSADLPESGKTAYEVDGVDVLFKNFPARAAYCRWSALPPLGSNTRSAMYRDVSSLPKFSGDASILNLARLDAWIATSLILSLRPTSKKRKTGEKSEGESGDDSSDEESSEDKKGEKMKKKGDKKEDELRDKDKKGRKKKKEDELGDEDEGKEAGPKARGSASAGAAQNHYHNAMFEVLLPRAIEGVLQELRDEVEKVCPEELHMPFSYEEALLVPELADNSLDIEAMDTLPSTKTPYNDTSENAGDGHEGDLHSQGWRKVTSSHFNPFDSKHYVFATPLFIRSNVCSWIGDIRDGFVGVIDPRNKEEDSEYLPIVAPNDSNT